MTESEFQARLAAGCTFALRVMGASNCLHPSMIVWYGPDGELLDPVKVDWMSSSEPIIFDWGDDPCGNASS